MILRILNLSNPLRALAIAGALAVTGATGAGAEGTERLGQDNDWAAYAAENDGGKTCYTLSTPKDTAPKNVNRDPVYFFVTFRPKDKIRNQVSVIIGYPFKEGTTVNLTIGAASFELFVDGEWAWPASEGEDVKILTAMKRGASAVVTGLSSRDTTTEDTFSLLGFTAALEEAERRCAGQ